MPEEPCPEHGVTQQEPQSCPGWPALALEQGCAHGFGDCSSPYGTPAPWPVVSQPWGTHRHIQTGQFSAEVMELAGKSWLSRTLSFPKGVIYSGLIQQSPACSLAVWDSPSLAALQGSSQEGPHLPPQHPASVAAPASVCFVNQHRKQESASKDWGRMEHGAGRLVLELNRMMKFSQFSSSERQQSGLSNWYKQL